MIKKNKNTIMDITLNGKRNVLLTRIDPRLLGTGLLLLRIPK